MNTQLTQPSDAKQAEGSKSASPKCYDIKTCDGRVLMGVPLTIIIQGLKAGWLGLDDEVRGKEKGETWTPIRESLGKTTFEVMVFVNPSRAYAKEYGETAGGLFGLLTLFSGYLYSGVMLLDLEIGEAFGFAVGLLIAVMGILRGAFMIFAIGIGLVAILSRIPMGSFLNLGFLLGLVVGSSVILATGAAIGYGFGYIIGLIIGSLRSGRYQLPNTRQPVPAAVESSYLVSSSQSYTSETSALTESQVDSNPK